MKTIVQQVEQWYAAHAEEMATHWACRLLVTEAEDVLRGKVVLQCEGQALVATLTLWNKGDVGSDSYGRAAEWERPYCRRRPSFKALRRRCLSAWFLRKDAQQYLAAKIAVAKSHYRSLSQVVNTEWYRHFQTVIRSQFPDGALSVHR